MSSSYFYGYSSKLCWVYYLKENFEIDLIITDIEIIVTHSESNNISNLKFKYN